MFSYVNEEPGLGPDPLCEELISVGGRGADSFRSLFCRGVALEWIIMYISGRIVFFIKILLSCLSNQYGRYPRSDKAFYDY